MEQSRIFSRIDGGDATENDDFQREKQRVQGTIFYEGDDPTKNGNFQTEKVGLLWNKNFQKHNLFSKWW